MMRLRTGARTSRRRGAITALSVLFVTLAGCGGDGDAPAGRVYELEIRAEDADEPYSFVAVDPIDIQVGDEVTFRMFNAGTLIHDLQVLDPGGTRLGAAEAVDAGGTLDLTVTFTEPGFHRLICDVDDHLIVYDMQAVVEVTEPEG